MSTRPATLDDLPRIRELFNVLIPTTTGAFRDHLASEEEMDTWFAQQQEAERPVLVATDDRGSVIGYATWSAFRGGPRFPGYRNSVEHTVHVDGDHHGRGVGQALMAALIDEATRQGVHVMIGGIDGENTASIAFHQAIGFVEVGRLPEVGCKFDRWLELVLMQRILS